jgi:hypothetical protein
MICIKRFCWLSMAYHYTQTHFRKHFQLFPFDFLNAVGFPPKSRPFLSMCLAKYCSLTSSSYFYLYYLLKGTTPQAS